MWKLSRIPFMYWFLSTKFLCRDLLHYGTINVVSALIILLPLYDIFKDCLLFHKVGTRFEKSNRARRNFY